MHVCSRESNWQIDSFVPAMSSPAPMTPSTSRPLTLGSEPHADLRADHRAQTGDACPQPQARLAAAVCEVDGQRGCRCGGQFELRSGDGDGLRDADEEHHDGHVDDAAADAEEACEEPGEGRDGCDERFPDAVLVDAAALVHDPLEPSAFGRLFRAGLKGAAPDEIGRSQQERDPEDGLERAAVGHAVDERPRCRGGDRQGDEDDGGTEVLQPQEAVADARGGGVEEDRGEGDGGYGGGVGVRRR